MNGRTEAIVHPFHLREQFRGRIGGNRPAFNRAMKSQGFTLHEERINSAATPTSAAYRGRLLGYVAP